jgi:hypothetical protein
MHDARAALAERLLFEVTDLTHKCRVTTAQQKRAV